MYARYPAQGVLFQFLFNIYSSQHNSVDPGKLSSLLSAKGEYARFLFVCTTSVLSTATTTTTTHVLDAS